ncbi:ATP-NAD kinase-like domain-containing protein [Naematelia encephala]|uniref:ATP-NAD kinase-like domain-containing protein n=1 Tax=Naematelia encephala TaxID=71784 RepID=A0A1Y2BE89_9TREE|nr:ATP-NAD kinase-like domain-containing protein [Naematelia encephala]
MPEVYHLIVNPAAGHGKAPEFVQNHVVPLLHHLGIAFELHETKGVRDAGRIGAEILTTTSFPVKVVIAGGDGTAHEMIEGVLKAERDKKDQALGRWELVILPLGTANALFSSLFPQPPEPPSEPSSLVSYLSDTGPDVLYQLSSLLASLKSTTPARRLPITLTSLESPISPPTEPIQSHIVLSTALHAAILSDSEALRSSYPGLERFKIAADQNLGVFFKADVRLIPPHSGKIKQYDPSVGNWVDPFTFGEDTLSGPFAYFLSTTTTPRLEPSFVISPLLATLPPNPSDPPTMDIIVLRPLRDPAVRSALASRGDEAASETWKSRIRQVMGWAYKGGGHVDLTYPAHRGETEVKGGGEVVVETFRCGGFEWVPTDAEHEPSHIVCADGSLHTIERNGKATVQVMDPGHDNSDDGFWVWA